MTPDEPTRQRTADETREAVRRAWTDALEVPTDLTGTFFGLGGDSMTAFQLCSRLSRSGIEVEVSEIFEDPTLTELQDLAVGGTADPDLRRTA